MLPDFKMIVHKFPKNDIVIYPISDVHLGAAEHNSEAWIDFVSEIACQENAYVILGGDLINNATRSSVSNIFEETMRPREQKRRMTEMLRPLAASGKILAAVSGNHERRSGARDADDDPTYDILCKLDIEDVYRENMAFVKLHFGDDGIAGDRNPTYIFTVTHGSGGGFQVGSAANKAEKTGYYIDGCDCLIVGHTHRPFVTQPAKICINPQRNQVYLKPFKVVSMTSWMDYGGYAMQKMLPPTSIAPQVIKLHGRKKKIEVTI